MRNSICIYLSSCLLALTMVSGPVVARGGSQAIPAVTTAELVSAFGQAGVSAGIILREDPVATIQPLSGASLKRGPGELDAILQSFANTHPELRVLKSDVVRVFDPRIVNTFRVVQHGLIDNQPLPGAFSIIARLLESNPSPIAGGIAGTGRLYDLGRITMQVNVMAADRLLDEFVRASPGSVWQLTRSRRGAEEVDHLSVSFPDGSVTTHLKPVQLFDPPK